MREHCVQYKESDWSFVKRLMVDEGISRLGREQQGGRTGSPGAGGLAPAFGNLTRPECSSARRRCTVEEILKKGEAMTRSRRTHRLPGGLALAVAALAVGYAILRPVHRRWGATDEEVARPMPGDLEIIGWTRAVSIEASADRIWPWLAQWGQGAPPGQASIVRAAVEGRAETGRAAVEGRAETGRAAKSACACTHQEAVARPPRQSQPFLARWRAPHSPTDLDWQRALDSHSTTLNAVPVAFER